jgi:hypothetical protein
MLQTNKVLKHLSINCVMLGDLGARTVAEGFAKNNTVKVKKNILLAFLAFYVSIFPQVLLFSQVHPPSTTFLGSLSLV